jgi:hypothetical protein
VSENSQKSGHSPLLSERSISEEELTRVAAVSGYPVLLRMNAAGKVEYLGGYARSKPSRAVSIDWSGIEQRTQNHEKAFPIYGCASKG